MEKACFKKQITEMWHGGEKKKKHLGAFELVFPVS